MVLNPKNLNSGQSFSGIKVLLALATGLLLGCAVAYFLKVLIDHSPADMNLRQLRLFYLMVISSGGLEGFAIETMRQLQEEATDPAYRHAVPTAPVVPKESIDCNPRQRELEGREHPKDRLRWS